MEEKYIVSVSFGKDSLAMLLKLIELHYQHRKVIYDKDADDDIELNNIYPIIELLNKNNEQIAELKKQLEEKEKDNQFFKKMYLSEKQKNDNYHTKKYGLDKPVEELRKIKLTPKEKEIYYKGFDNCERQFATHIAELQQQLKETKVDLLLARNEIDTLKGNLTILNEHKKVIEEQYLEKCKELKSQPAKIVEKIIYHYDLNQIRDQFKNGFYGDARCVAIDGLGLIYYLEEMLKEYQK